MEPRDRSRRCSGVSALVLFFAPDTQADGGGGGGGIEDDDVDVDDDDDDDVAGPDESRFQVFSLMAWRFLEFLLLGCLWWWNSASKSATILVISSVICVLRGTTAHAAQHTFI